MNRKHLPIARHLFSRWLLACGAWLAATRMLDTKAGNGFRCTLSAERTVHCRGPKNEHSQLGVNYNGRNASSPNTTAQRT